MQSPKLHPGEQLRLKKAIAERVYQLTDNPGARTSLFRAIYSGIKERFKVDSYRNIKQVDLQAALRFVRNWRGV